MTIALRLMTPEEVAEMDAAEPVAVPAAKRTLPPRCGLCGLFMRRDGYVGWRCTREVDVYPRAWGWEHL